MYVYYVNYVSYVYYVCMCVCLSVCLAGCLPACLAVCLPVCMYVCMYTVCCESSPIKQKGKSAQLRPSAPTSMLVKTKQDVKAFTSQASKRGKAKHAQTLKHPAGGKPSLQFNGFWFSDWHKCVIFTMVSDLPRLFWASAPTFCGFYCFFAGESTLWGVCRKTVAPWRVSGGFLSFVTSGQV